jgi:hypothetical protein
VAEGKMLVDTITIALDGEIPLSEFARTIGSFYELVRALSDETGNPSLDWVLDDLQVSSAVATIRAAKDPRSAEIVANAYVEVGQSLENHVPIKHTVRVQQAARKLVSIRDYRVKAIRFETPVREVVYKVQVQGMVNSPEPSLALAGDEDKAQDQPRLAIARATALGGVQGRIQALSNRGGLRFTIYDLFHDKAIGCYVAEGKDELLRNMWGKLATVEGVITRDPFTGRPLSIRQISNITPLPELIAGEGRAGYLEARGILQSSTLPEDAIRRIRDAN